MLLATYISIHCMYTVHVLTYILINPAPIYEVLMISAISPRQKWQKLWQKYFLPCFSPSCGRNTFLPGRKPTLVGCLAFGSRPVGSPANCRWGPDRSVPQNIAVGGPTCRLPRHCRCLYWNGQWTELVCTPALPLGVYLTL